jgi:hypothetical protein
MWVSVTLNIIGLVLIGQAVDLIKRGKQIIVTPVNNIGFADNNRVDPDNSYARTFSDTWHVLRRFLEETLRFAPMN